MEALLSMSTRIRFRRDTAANWTSNNPTLTTGELGYETNTGKFKIGNNTNAWTALPYSITAELSEGNLNDLKDVTITSAADGDFLRWNGTAWINDAVNLSTDTIGSYVASLVAGTGVTLTNNSGEGATPTVAVTANTFDAFGAASTAATNAATALTNHEADTTSIHGIADTSILVTTTGSQTLTNKTITSPSGLVKGDVGLGSVDNTADTAKPVSTAQQSALNLKANLASPTFTGTVTIPSGASISGFAPLASPALTGTPTAPTAAASTNTTQVATTAFVRGEVTALVNGATATLDTLGEIATALGNDANLSTTLTTSIGLKAPLASPTFTGTVTIPTGASITAPTGLVKGDVGLGSVDNTADTAKPVSTAQQTALDLKANLASPTFTGTVTIPSGASISGFAPLASPALTGNPTATTQTAGNNTTRLATTAFVTDAVSTGVSGVAINTLNDIGDVTAPSPSSGDLLKWNGTAWVNATGYALLASPALTGTPTAPTASANTNTGQVATTAFVTTAISTISPSTTILDGGNAYTLQFYVMGAVNAGGI